MFSMQTANNSQVAGDRCSCLFRPQRIAGMGWTQSECYFFLENVRNPDGESGLSVLNAKARGLCGQHPSVMGAVQSACNFVVIGQQFR